MRLYLPLVLVLLSASLARAQDQSVECDDARTACEDAMLAACPGGASIVDEQVSLRPAAEGAPGGKHYAIHYRCTGASADVPAAEQPKAAEPFAGFPADERPRQPAPPPSRVDDRRARETEELRYLDTRIRELEVERKQYSLAGPIVFSAVAGVGVLFSALRLAVARSAVDDDSGDSYTARKQAKRSTIGVLACGAGVLGGFVWLGFTQRKRDATTPELKELRRRRRDLVRYGLAFDPLSRELQLSARF